MLTPAQTAILDETVARLMKSARHLSSSRMAGTMYKLGIFSGISWVGSSKSTMAYAVAEKLCCIRDRSYNSSGANFQAPDEDAIKRAELAFRVTQNSNGAFGAVEADRAWLLGHSVALQREIEDQKARSEKFKLVNGRTNYALENPIFSMQRELYVMKAAIAHLDGVRVSTN